MGNLLLVFHFSTVPSPELWECGNLAGFCEISKERWEEWKSWFWISTLSTTPPFPQLFCSAHGPPACPHLSIVFSPRVAGLRRRRLPSRLPWFDRRFYGRLRGDLLVTQSSAPVPDFQPTVFPFAYHYLTLAWRIAALPLYLEQPLVVPHHPVVADRAPGLQPERFVQFRPARPAAVIVRLRRRRAREPFIVLGQILPLQIRIGGRIALDLLARSFFTSRS